MAGLPRGEGYPRVMRPLSRLRLPTSLVLALALAAGLVVGRPAPVGAAEGYQLDLYRSGDFVAQTNLVQCVGASMQMMINMVAAQDDRTAETQRQLWLLARAYSPPRPPDRPPRKGASVWGWAKGLDKLGFGPYRVVGFPSLEEAARAAARSMRATGRPVGLLVWAGRHAWVMSGFRASGDPLSAASVDVTHVYVLDPLYPRDSRTWGDSPAPGEALSVAALGKQFVPRRRSWTGSMGGMWVIVMPLLVERPLTRLVSRAS
jgi:hypothetical protein